MMRAPAPDRAAAWLPRSVAFAAAVSAVLAATTTKEGLSHWIAAWALAVLLPALVLAALPPSPARADDHGDHIAASAWLTALNVVALLLIVPAMLAIWPGEWSAITGWRSPFLDKRWLLAAYAIGMIGLGVLPVVLDRVMRADTAVVMPETAPHGRRWVRILELAIVLGAVWYLAGPPWNLGAHRRGMDPAEQVLLGPLNAIAHGTTPYVGAASTSWGPGSQAAVYAYMSTADRFTLVGFREGTLVLQFVATLLVASVAWVHLGFASCWIAIALAMIVTPLGFFTFQPDGAFGDAYGSATPLRFIAPLVVVPWLTALACRGRRNHRVAALIAGAMWALLSWADQSNLIATAVAAAASLTLCYSTSSSPWPRIKTIVSSVMAGFVIVSLVILVYYTVNGHLLDFVRNYWMLPRAFAAGFANTAWLADVGDPWGRAFRWTPAIILAILAATVWDVRQWRARRPLSASQVALVAFLCVLAACYPWALERSDPRHMIEAMTALPFVLVLLFRDLPAWVTQTQVSRGGLRVAIVLLIVAVFPVRGRLLNLYAEVVRPPSGKYGVPAPPVPPNATVASGRGGLLSDHPVVFVENTGAMGKFLADAEAIKQLIGDRPTLVQSAGPYRSGLLYFAANLAPAPQLYTEALIINDRVQSNTWQHFQANLDRVECVIASSPDAFEMKAFLAAHPSVTPVSMPLGVGAVLVAIR